MIICIMGVPCVGKTTLVKNLKERHKEIDLYVPIKNIKVEKEVKNYQHRHHQYYSGQCSKIKKKRYR